MSRPPSRGGVYGNRRAGPSFQPVVILAVAALVVLVLGWLLYSWLFGGGCNSAFCPAADQVEPPQGFEAVSELFEYRGEAPSSDEDVVVTLPLDRNIDDARGISFYIYRPETTSWEPGVAATPTGDGNRVEGVFSDVPQFVAVLRRTSSAGQVAVYINRGQVLHPDAVARATIIHPRTYTPQPDGTLAGDPIAVEAGDLTAIYPVISAGNAYPGTLQNVETILADGAARTAHIQQILQAVTAGNLAGIDIAYADLRADQRSSFTLFVAELAGQLHAADKILTLTLPPPAVANDRVDEGAYNWAALGSAADLIKISPHRDQGTYRLAMPRVFEYLASIVDPAKILLTVTPYASEKTADAVRPLTLTEAMGIASRIGVRSSDIHTGEEIEIAGINIDATENLSGVRWDPSSATVAFSYKEGDAGRTIWLENEFSVGFKLELISRFSLGGVAIEDASADVYIGDIWPAIVPFIDTGQPRLVQPDPTSLAPQWSASQGPIEPGERGVATWTAPDRPGDYTLYLTLSDGISLFQGELTVQATVGSED